jgi:hypothetical protein
MKCKGVLICIPAMGQMMNAQTAATLYSVGQLLTKRGIPNRLSWYAAADIEDVRNLFVTVWYDHCPQFSHLLFIDADMGFDPQLVEDMLYFDKQVMGAIYARRKSEVSIVGTLEENHGLKDITKGFLKSPGGLGTGVMMISREAVTTMLEKMPHLSDTRACSLLDGSTEFNLKRILRCFKKIDEPDLILSEDMAFCHRHIQCGGEIWANVAYRISHIGPFDFGLKYQGIMERREAENRNAA